MTREPQTTERELEALLCAALDKDDGAGVLRILREGRTSVYMRMGQYETLMGRALGGKKLDVVAALLKAGASADTMCDLAAHAVEKGADDILAVVLAAGADPNRRDVYGWNLLGLAAWHGNVPAAEALLAAKADLSKTRETYGDPLASTGFSCDLPMAKALVQAKVDVDSPFTKECGMTALLFAAESVLDPAERDGGLDLVKYLLSAKADPTLPDTCGRTAVSYASDAGNLAIVQTLLEAKASLDATRNDTEQAFEVVMADEAEAGTAGASGTSTSSSASDAVHAPGAVPDGTTGTLAAHKPWFVEPNDGVVQTTTDAAAGTSGDAAASADAASDGVGNGASKGAAPAGAGDVAYDAAAHAVAAQAMVNYLLNQHNWRTDETFLDQLLSVVRASDKVPKGLRRHALRAVERLPPLTSSSDCKCVDALLEVAQKAAEDVFVGTDEVNLSSEALSVLDILWGPRKVHMEERGPAVLATVLKVLTEIVPKVTYEHKTAVEACSLLRSLLIDAYRPEASALEALANASSAFVRGIHDDLRKHRDAGVASKDGPGEYRRVLIAIRALQVLAAASVRVPECTAGRTLVEAGALDAALSLLGTRLFEENREISCHTADTIAFLLTAADPDKLLDVVRRHPDITDMFVEFAKMYMPGSWADGLVATGTTRFRIFAEGEALFTLTRRTIGAVIDRSVHGAYVACKKASDKLAEMARSDADQAKTKQAEAERAEAEQAKAQQAEAAYAELKTAYDVLRTERDGLRAERIACKAVLTQLQQTMQLLAAGTQ